MPIVQIHEVPDCSGTFHLQQEKAKHGRTNQIRDNRSSAQTS